MRAFLDAIQNGASGDEIAALPLPESYRGAVVRKDEVDTFEGMPSGDKDPRKSLHVDEVAVPELAPDEAYVAVMASAINTWPTTTWSTSSAATPARSRAAAMATPPRSAADSGDRAPESLPIGVRAPATRYEWGMGSTVLPAHKPCARQS